MIDHLEIQSTTFHRDSQEARSQPGTASSTYLFFEIKLLIPKCVMLLVSILASLAKKASALGKTSRKKQDVTEEDDDDYEQDKRFKSRSSDRKDSNSSDISESVEQKKNQFSFVERATQTKFNGFKVTVF